MCYGDPDYGRDGIMRREMERHERANDEWLSEGPDQNEEGDQ